MDRIGASASWEWHAYRNAVVDVDGKRLASVPGGGHWGGGLWIDAFDHARVGLLMLAGGTWDGAQILSPGWVEAALKPCPINPRYGFMWWLNPGPKSLARGVRTGRFAAVGAGNNIVSRRASTQPDRRDPLGGRRQPA